ncbi:MAG: hypothetical protein ACYDEX_24855 [Mobilitalea sp.]
MVLNTISALASIGGFILSIILIIITASVNKKIKRALVNEKDVKEFNKQRKDIKSNFESFQLLISCDKKFNNQLKIKIHNELLRLENFNSLLTKRDKKKIKKIRNEMSKGIKIDIERIAIQIGFFINRCDKQEVFWNGR